MKTTKTSYKMYPAWEFHREVEDLDELSQAGWQLKKGGCFHSKFVFDDTVRYRYALDYQPRLEDPIRYREMFQEQGWQFINATFNGWYYFRKAYDPSLSEEEYQIYTDTASIEALANRWSRLGYTFGTVELLLAVMELIMNLRHPHIMGLAIGIACLMLGVILLMGAYRNRHPRRDGKPARRMGWLLGCVMLVMIFGVVYGSFQCRASTATEYPVPADNEPWTWGFSVSLPDFYTLELDVDAPADVTVCLVNERERDSVKALVDGRWVSGGGVLYSARGQNIHDDVTMFLMPGNYYVSTQYDPGAETGLAGWFEYELD